ncbi:MAG: hypothetical protein ACKOQ6_03810, partial [Bacteroidota bacterium]
MKHLLTIRSLFVFSFLLVSSLASGQVYLLNEDFATSFGTTQPNTWSNYSSPSTSASRWRFDNPGNRPVNYPMVGKVAIVDGQSPTPANGSDTVILETPFI